ncbi:MAG: glycosidase [Bacteroidetes bacterium HGW-Bacteroidetes-13]|nr:MAG: glycosidase [Bacteroidetes bacterium HGW-Bacteroidetes-13]
MKNIRLSFFVLLLISVGCKNESAQKLEFSTKSWVMEGFQKADSINPILKPTAESKFVCPISGQEVAWEARNTLNPSAVVKDGKVYLFYRAQDPTGTSRIGLAISSDGLHFEKSPQPVFYPDNDDMKIYEWNLNKQAGIPQPKGCTTCYFDGVEDPRIVEREDGTYLMTYTAYDGKTARLALATSKDLVTWEKKGLAFNTEKYIDEWSKSGAIVCKKAGDKVIATKIDGKYWMYFGDTQLSIAYSDDLIHWTIAVNEENQNMISVLHPRPGYFDSRLVEPGPFALLQEAGILLIYNASNAANFNDSQLPKFTYAAGQALFDKENPVKLIDREASYFIHPDKDYEKIGEVNDVCFVEGLVFLNNQSFLYYGTADSKVAVAVRE